MGDARINSDALIDGFLDGLLQPQEYPHTPCKEIRRGPYEEEEIPGWLTELDVAGAPDTGGPELEGPDAPTKPMEPVRFEDTKAEEIDTEAELAAGLEELSPEDAFAAWEAMQAEGVI